MNKTVWTSFTILCLLSTVFLIRLAFDVQPVRAEPRIWTVDDDGPADFHTIQEAINAANLGDTILVSAGDYEPVHIWKSNLKLVGEQANTTIIKGEGQGAIVSLDEYVSNLIISGFTIQNGAYGIKMSRSNNNNTISHNIITKNSQMAILIPEIYVAEHSEDNRIVHNHILNNGFSDPAINLLSHSRRTVVSSNVIKDNLGGGIRLNSINNIINDNVISNHSLGSGIWVEHAYSFNTIFRNTITDNWKGVSFYGQGENTAYGNTIINNSIGLYLSDAYYVKVYHNNLIHNVEQVKLYFGGSDGFNLDDDYPSGGNYWSDYKGDDLFSGPYQNETDSDGIGDTPYDIEENRTDNYPLMGMFSDFNATLECPVHTICNSSISDFQFNGTAISFNFTGKNGTTGFCRIRIPRALMNGTFTIYVDGVNTTYSLLPCSNATYNYLYFTYHHSTRKVEIIPEFPSVLVLPLLMIFTFVAVTLSKRKRTK